MLEQTKYMGYQQILFSSIFRQKSNPKRCFNVSFSNNLSWLFWIEERQINVEGFMPLRKCTFANFPPLLKQS